MNRAERRRATRTAPPAATPLLVRLEDQHVVIRSADSPLRLAIPVDELDHLIKMLRDAERAARGGGSTGGAVDR